MSQLAEQLYQLSQESFAHGSPWALAQFEAALTDNLWLFVERNQQLSAFLQYQQVLDEVEIYNLVVAKDQKKQGLASDLLRQLFIKCQQGGVQKIFLEVRQNNESARNFYQKHGFTEQGLRKNYYHAPTENAVVLMKEIK